MNQTLDNMYHNLRGYIATNLKGYLVAKLTQNELPKPINPTVKLIKNIYDNCCTSRNTDEIVTEPLDMNIGYYSQQIIIRPQSSNPQMYHISHMEFRDVYDVIMDENYELICEQDNSKLYEVLVDCNQVKKVLSHNSHVDAEFINSDLHNLYELLKHTSPKNTKYLADLTDEFK